MNFLASRSGDYSPTGKSFTVRNGGKTTFVRGRNDSSGSSGGGGGSSGGRSVVSTTKNTQTGEITTNYSDGSTSVTQSSYASSNRSNANPTTAQSAPKPVTPANSQSVTGFSADKSYYVDPKSEKLYSTAGYAQREEARRGQEQADYVNTQWDKNYKEGNYVGTEQGGMSVAPFARQEKPVYAENGVSSRFNDYSAFTGGTPVITTSEVPATTFKGGSRSKTYAGVSPLQAQFLTGTPVPTPVMMATTPQNSVYGATYSDITFTTPTPPKAVTFADKPIAFAGGVWNKANEYGSMAVKGAIPGAANIPGIPSKIAGAYSAYGGKVKDVFNLSRNPADVTPVAPIAAGVGGFANWTIERPLSFGATIGAGRVAGYAVSKAPGLVGKVLPGTIKGFGAADATAYGLRGA